jgi:hypothetical protein
MAGVHAELLSPAVIAPGERAITTALSPLDGVERVQVRIPAKQVCVTYDPARVDIAITLRARARARRRRAAGRYDHLFSEEPTLSRFPSGST